MAKTAPRTMLLGVLVLVLILAGAFAIRWHNSKEALGSASPAPFAPDIASEVAVNLDTDRIVITLQDAPQLLFPAPTDSNSPAVWLDGRLAVINSTSDGAYISRGDSIDNLTETMAVALPAPDRPGTAWIEALWQDPDTGILYGWYHFEPEDLDCYPLTAPAIGAAVSYDGGTTWEDRGFVIENGYEHDCHYQNVWFSGGSGDFSVILDVNSEHFYFVYSNYLGAPEEIGVAVARSAFEDRGQPGSVWKYYRGDWREPGLGGRTTAVFRSRTGWQGPGVDAFWGPSVHWNSYLGTYVALLNRAVDTRWTPDEIYVAFSRDLIHWTAPEAILQTYDWYPQVIGLDEGGTDSSAGKVMRIFVGGLSNWLLEFSLSSQEVHEPQAAPHQDPAN